MTDATCLERSEARRRVGEQLRAWLFEAEHVITRADVRQVAALVTELTGQRVRGTRR